MMIAWNKLRRMLSAFKSARGGNVAITFAFAMLPIMGFVGAAIDYSRANSVKAAMQTALDSAALMLSKEAATDTNDQLQANAMKFFSALFVRPEATDIVVNATYGTTGGSNIKVDAQVSLPAEFVRVLGFKTFTVKASSTAKWGVKRLRVALVLDNTGSMSSAGKMDALQTATKNLLNQLQGAVVTAGDVYVSIIPFVKDVNLIPANYNSSWIYWDDAAHTDNSSWDANNGTCTASGTDRNSCQQSGTCSISGVTSQNRCGTCSLSSYNRKNQCQSNGGTWTAATWTPGVWTAANHNTWNGCVVDRGNPGGPDTTNNYDTNALAPDTSVTSSLYAAEQYSSCPQAVKGLNYDWAAMATMVDSMTPAGNTNQGIGLQVGWMSLVGGGPFTVPAKEVGYEYSEAIILLTDGLNTQNRWYTSQSSIDNRQATTCANIKAAKIDLYTIQVNTGGDPTSTLLQNCASSPDKFFLLTSADQIVAAFQAIGTNLTKLRVAY